jgi:hypothetical protein
VAKARTLSQALSVYDFIAATVAWQYMKPRPRVFEHADTYEFVAQYMTGAQWGYFMDGFLARTPSDSSGVLSKHRRKYPSYMHAYQAGRLAREIAEAHAVTPEAP